MKCSLLIGYYFNCLKIDKTPLKKKKKYTEDILGGIAMSSSPPGTPLYRNYIE